MSDGQVGNWSTSAYQGSGWGEFNAYGCADIRSEVQGVKSDVREALAVLTNQLATNNLNLHNRLCESEKAAIETGHKAELMAQKAEFEAKLAAEKVIKEVGKTVMDESQKVQNLLTYKTDRLEDKVSHAVEELSEATDHTQEEISEQIASFEKGTFAKFFHAREEDLEREIDELQSKVDCCECSDKVAESVISKLVQANILGGTNK